MFINKVPFPGTMPMKVYADIKARNIQWPDDEVLKPIMSLEARDLIERLLQLSPGNRLGHNMESMKVLKGHPFFTGVDFAAISKKNYTGLSKLLVDKHPRLSEIDLDKMNLLDVDEGNTIEPLRVVHKGNLCKKNWYGNKQLRFFELYSDGELKYYKDITEFKGSIKITPSSKIIKEGKSTLLIDDMAKKKQYVIM